MVYPRDEIYWALHNAAAQFLEHNAGVIVTARAVCSQNEMVERIRRALMPATEFFENVCSESRSFPVADVRKYWQPAALAKEDKKIAELEDRYRDQMTAACHNLISELERLSPTTLGGRLGR